MASGTVWVTPRNEPANISVAPNSPSARPSASAVPAASPGIATGIITRSEAARLGRAERPRGVEQRPVDGREGRHRLAHVERRRDERERHDHAGGRERELDAGGARPPRRGSRTARPRPAARCRPPPAAARAEARSASRPAPCRGTSAWRAGRRPACRPARMIAIEIAVVRRLSQSASSAPGSPRLETSSAGLECRRRSRRSAASGRSARPPGSSAEQDREPAGPAHGAGPKPALRRALRAGALGEPVDVLRGQRRAARPCCTTPAP